LIEIESVSSDASKWKLIAAIAVGLVLLQGAIQLIVFTIETRNSALAAEIFDQAKQASEPTWTMDDAKTWLKSKNFAKIMTGEGTTNKVNQPSKRFKVVTGSQQIYDGSWIAKPMTIWIDFHFGIDLKFESVEYGEWPFPIER
jgi:hypothetical protein